MGRTIKLLLIYFAYNLACIGIFTVIYMLQNGMTEMPAALDISTAIWAQFISTTAVGIHIVAGKYVSREDFMLKSHRKTALLSASALLMVAMGLWTNYLSELAELPDNMKDIFEQMMNNPLGVISIVVMAPIVEELLFRGAIQGHLSRKWNKPFWAIVVSSLIFGAVHGNPAQIPFAFVVGMALGWIYHITGSLIPGILMHFINNGSAVLLYSLSGDADATMISSIGDTWSLVLAFGGMILTVLCFLYINRKLAPELRK